MSLTPNYTFVGRGNWSIDGAGGQNPAAAVNRTISAIVPEGSRVEAAFLYTSTFFTSATPSSVTLTRGSDSTDVTSYTALGVTAGLQAFRSDITTFIRAAVDDGDDDAYDFAISDITGTNIDGYALVVVYSNPDESIRTISLLDGFSATGGDDFELEFAEPVDTEQDGFEAQMSLGIGFSFWPSNQFSRITVDGRQLTQSAGAQDDGTTDFSSIGNGGLLTIGGIGDSTDNPDPDQPIAGVRTDDELYDLAKGNVDDDTPYLADEATSIAVTTINPSNDDNIFFAGFNITAVVGVGTEENDPPTAVNDEVEVDEDDTVTFDVLDNDFDVDEDDEFNITGFNDDGLVGTLTDNGDGSFTYDPGDEFDDLNEGEEETTSFTYTISDGEETATGTVTITIRGEDEDTGENDPPVAEDDDAEVDEDDTVEIDVLDNDSDPDSDPLSVDAIDTTGLVGTLVLNGDGTFTYDPNGQFDDLDEGEEATTSFSYTVTDGEETDTATVTITVRGEDDDVDPPTDCPTVDRPDTEDGSDPSDETLTGVVGANTFYFDNGGDTGDDNVTNFEAVDVLVTDLALRDSNNDGFIGFGANGILDLSGAGGTVTVDGIMNLRFLGEACEDNWVYAAAYVRPDGAEEGYVLSDDILAGDDSDSETNVFFFDTALQLALGNDTINGFGSGDLLVTTTAIADNNGDGIIGFGADALLDLTGGGGKVEMTDTADAAITSLEFDGEVTQDGVTYYVYSTVGSSVGVDALG